MSSPGARSRGFTMIEILVSLLLIVFGLLGMLGLQAQATVAEFESYQRGQAMILAQDMVDRINANRKAVLCYVTTDTTTDPTAPSPAELGAGTADRECSVPTTGTPTTRAMATADIVAWDEALKGAAERTGSSTGTRVGSILFARGCVTQISAATNTYRVAVAWQGMAPTVTADSIDPNATCGKTKYGTNDAVRREVGITFRIANLTGA
jgi:type IV pilus assembly protein PilV